MGSLSNTTRNFIDSGNNAGYGKSRYSDWVTSREMYADRLFGSGENGALDHMFSNFLSGTKQAGKKGLGTLYEGVYRGARIGGKVFRAMGGVEGTSSAAVFLGAQGIGMGLRGLQAMEAGARTLLTGGAGPQPKNALEAYLPGWSRFDWSDIRKYAVNPRIARRYVGARAAMGLVAGMNEALNPSIAPPSLYLGAGGQIRHKNDLGASAAYGQQILGPNSVLSGFSQMSTAQKMALLDTVI